MIVFNGMKFAKNQTELVNSLFNTGGTCSGLYRKTKNGTKLYKGNGELFAYIVHNDKQGYFVVSACEHDGKARYMFGLCSLDEQYLGLSGKGMAETKELIESIQIH
jgi:hypothetical protein